MHTNRKIAVKGEYRVDDLFRSHPKFAVINMNGNANAINLAKNLLQNGYNDVGFYDDLTQHPHVQEIISKNLNFQKNLEKNSSGHGVQIQITKTVPINPFSLSSSPPTSTSSLPTPSDISQSSPTPEATSSSLSKPHYQDTVDCQLCSSSIPIIRYSHLVSHVAKHCPLKKFNCTQCTFASNGKVKVLAHMKQQHLLLNTEPIQRSHEEIQPVIDRLMDECFPDYNQKLAVIRKSHVKDDGNGVGKSLSFSIYHCAECHLAVKCVDGREFSPDSGLMTHLQEVHTQNCMPWRCGECNWRSDVEWKVRRHICIRHTDQANTVKVTKDRVPDWKMFIARHFIDLPAGLVPPNEDEETDEKLDTARVFWDTVVEKTRKRRRLRH